MDMFVAPIRPNTSDTGIIEYYRSESIDALDLLQHNRVLYKDDDYIVIDKPADVRMNGDFDITVEKLLIKSFPRLATVNLKWIHQLDYATSGVLCVGLNREAAAIASLAFENRETEKAYLAVLEGTVIPNKWPTKSIDQFDHRIDITSSRENGDTLVTSKDSIVVKEVQWQEIAMKRQLTECLEYLTKITTGHNDTHVSEAVEESVENDLELQELKSISQEVYEKSSKLRKKLRKFLKRKGAPLSDFEGMIESEQKQLKVLQNQAAVDTDMSEAATIESVTLRKLRVASELSAHNFMYYEDATNRLVIQYPIAEIAGDFRMEIGHDTNTGRPSTTYLEVLGYASYQGRPVTKVKLFPKTGRRHQLRVHTASIGHGIVGDWTYSVVSQNARLALRPNDPTTGEIIGTERTLREVPPSCTLIEATSCDNTLGAHASARSDCLSDDKMIGRAEDRMMLHAFELRIPVSANYKPTRKSSPRFVELYQRAKEGLENSSIVDIIGRDPFTIRDGILNIH